MAQIGDAIQKARVLVGDLSATIGAPPALTPSAVADATSTLTPDTYAHQVTWFTRWGESSPNASQNQVIGSAEALVVGGSTAYSAWAGTTAYSLGDVRRPTTPNGHAYICIVAGTSSASEPTWPITSRTTIVDATVTWQEWGPQTPIGITKFRVYYGIGSPTAWAESATLPITINSAGTVGAPPAVSTAYLPDTDGQEVSAASMFEWLNDALKIGARLVGGIRDVTGLRAISGQSIYDLSGQWSDISMGWFDGYGMAPASKHGFLRQNRTTSQSWAYDSYHMSNRHLVEIYPAPNRSGLSTTLDGAITATSTSLVLDSVANLLDHGLIQIESEIIAYQGRDTATLTLSGLVRGIGGTVATTHADAIAVSELNLFFVGLRLHTQEYVPGDSALTLPVPVGWESVLHFYLVAMFREAKREYDEHRSKLQVFHDSILEWGRTNRQNPLPTQVGDNSVYEPEVFGGGLGGGFIIP